MSTAGSSLGTPGLAHPIGASRLDYASPRQSIWAHNTSGSLLLRHPRLRRQQLRASSSEGQPLQTFQGFGRLIIAGARVTLTPLAKQLFRMQRDLTPSSTYTFAATGNRYAFPEMLLPESPSCSYPKLLAPESPSGSLTLRSLFVDRLLWTPWTRLVSGCIWQVRRPFGIKRLCACICASGSSFRAIGKACTECAAAFHSALVHRTVVCANFPPVVIGRAPGCLSSTACHPVRPRFEATSPGAQSLLSLTQLVLQPRFEACTCVVDAPRLEEASPGAQCLLPPMLPVQLARFEASSPGSWLPPAVCPRVIVMSRFEGTSPGTEPSQRETSLRPLTMLLQARHLSLLASCPVVVAPASCAFSVVLLHKGFALVHGVFPGCPWSPEARSPIVSSAQEACSRWWRLSQGHCQT